MRRRISVLILSATTVLAVVAPAQAVAPSQRAAVAAARQEAKQLAREAHASGYRVVGCRRSGSARYVCQVQNSFSKGARKCTATVVVRFVRGRARTSASNYVCF